MRSVAHGGWLDFYAFNIGGRWQLSMMLVFAGAWVLCFLLLFPAQLLRERARMTGAGFSFFSIIR